MSPLFVLTVATLVASVIYRTFCFLHVCNFWLVQFGLLTSLIREFVLHVIVQYICESVRVLIIKPITVDHAVYACDMISVNIISI